MRKLFKSSSLIIFASVIMGMFASCGNDSELFDEPIMYQTRAMMGMDTRNEGEKRDYVTTDGPSEGFYNIRTKEAKIKVEFHWRRGLESIVSGEYNASVHFVDENSEAMYPIEYDDPYVYTYEIVEQLSITQDKPSITIGNFNEKYLAAEVRGKIKEYIYHRYDRKYDTITHTIAEIIIASESLKIRSMTDSEFNNSFNLRNYTPLNFETTDSLNIQKQ